MLATKDGFIKKTHISAYANPRRGGIIAVILREGDELIAAKLTSGSDDIILAKRKGKAIRFSEKDVRDMGRSTQGVTGVKLDKDDEVVAMVVVKRGAELLAVTEHGYGKRTRIGDFRNIKRGGKGVVAISTDARNGDLVAVKEVIEEDEVMIITRNGIIIRSPVNSISILGRPAKGVKLISLAEGDAVVDVTLMAGEKISEGEIAEGDEGEEMDGEKPATKRATRKPANQPAGARREVDAVNPGHAIDSPARASVPRRHNAAPRAGAKTRSRTSPSSSSSPAARAPRSSGGRCRPAPASTARPSSARARSRISPRRSTTRRESRHIRRRPYPRPGAQHREEPRNQRHRSHRAHPRHLRPARAHEAGADPGGDRAAQLRAAAAQAPLGAPLAARREASARAGPGETQIEVDRRRARDRMASLAKELEKIHRGRRGATQAARGALHRHDRRLHERRQIDAPQPDRGERRSRERPPVLDPRLDDAPRREPAEASRFS